MRSLSAMISKLVMRLVRHYDQEERGTDGVVHWDTKKTKTAESISIPKSTKVFGQGVASPPL